MELLIKFNGETVDKDNELEEAKIMLLQRHKEKKLYLQQKRLYRKKQLQQEIAELHILSKTGERCNRGTCN